MRLLKKYNQSIIIFTFFFIFLFGIFQNKWNIFYIETCYIDLSLSVN